MMKKYLILILILFFSVGSVFAENTSTPQQNVSIYKSQADATTSKMASLSFLQKAALDNLVVNLLSENQITKIRKDSEELRNLSKSAEETNILIIELEMAAINKHLKMPVSKTELKKLTTSQKYAIRKDLDQLLNIQSSYSQISTQSEKLVKDIKVDTFVELSLKKELNNLTKTQATSKKQDKQINKLIYNLVDSAAQVGVVFK